MTLIDRIIHLDGTVEDVEISNEDFKHIEKMAEETRRRREANAEAEAKREAALSKLAALGLTADDLKALGL